MGGHAVVVAVAALVLAACGTAESPAPGAEGGQGESDITTGSTDGDGDQGEGTGAGQGTPAGDGAPQTIGPDTEVVGIGTVLQAEPDGPAMLCVGGVLDSLPPQCSGPALEGEFSWDDVDAEEQSGVRWTNEAYVGVGHLDLAARPEGTFTLTRPLSLDWPEGFAPPERDDVDFPQLCDDPTADVGDVDQAARTGSGEGFGEEQALVEYLHEGELDDYVSSWVSDGGAVFNVVVGGDADQARGELRKIFSGPLCVEQRDLPSEQDRLAAQQALHAGDVALLGSAAGTVSGQLEVDAVIADQATIDKVHELVSEWLTPDQVVVTGHFQPLDQ
ncbi:hypothetical protein [Ornithinimicrobium sp. Y1694]|uniref:hypothetical protein n=1 Tax=Ornithinimicrobium sp. Y1694 TaxID=3418590 RepID=UPI003CF81FC8